MDEVYRSGVLTELLESRRMLSATTQSLPIGSVLYTATQSGTYDGGSDLFRSNLDGSNPQLLGHWQSGIDGPANLFALGNKLLFTADFQNEWESGSELWSSDGTPGGTIEIADLYGGEQGSYPHDFSAFGNSAVFVAADGDPNNNQIYTTDGTSAGTQRLSPFQQIAQGQEDFDGSVSNVAVSSGTISWDQYNDYLDQTEHLTSSGDGYSIQYAEPVDGVAQIGINDQAAHAIRVSQANGFIDVSDDDGSYPRDYRFRVDDVTSLLIQGGAGADVINIDSTITEPTKISGNFGADAIIDHRAGGDSIDGGDGADTITASVSADTIVADAADTLIDTDSSISTGGGNDTTGGGSGGATVITPDPAPSFSLHDGVLRVNGTDGSDTIKLISSAGSIKLTLDGETNKVLRSSVESIIVTAGDGSDVVSLRNLTIKSRIYGGAGDDSITGSAGKDRIYGGDGNDWISGGDNHDTIYGEAGNDHLFGGNASDYLVGGTGVNTLRGEAGVDHILYDSSDNVSANGGDKLELESILNG